MMKMEDGYLFYIMDDVFVTVAFDTVDQRMGLPKGELRIPLTNNPIAQMNWEKSEDGDIVLIIGITRISAEYDSFSDLNVQKGASSLVKYIKCALRTINDAILPTTHSVEDQDQELLNIEVKSKWSVSSKMNIHFADRTYINRFLEEYGL